MTDARSVWTLAVELEREHGERALFRLAEIVVRAARERDKDAIRLWRQVVHTMPALRVPQGSALLH
jgi:hypothetical protein